MSKKDQQFSSLHLITINMSDSEDRDQVNEMDEDEDEFDDEYYGDLGEPLHLAADHILMQPLQDALKKQLTDDLERVDLTLREKEEHLKKLRREREDIGVQLYGVQ